MGDRIMSKPIIKIHNVETGEVIEREMTAEEYAQHQIDVAAYEAHKLTQTVIDDE